MVDPLHAHTSTHVNTQGSNAAYYKSYSISIVSKDTSPASVTMATINKGNENKANKMH